jgi:hypothetical protein
MQHRFKKAQLNIEIPLPGQNPGIATSTGSFFTSDKDFDIVYDDSSQLVTISKEGDRRVVHVSKVNVFEPFEEDPKPAAKPQPVKKAV